MNVLIIEDEDLTAERLESLLLRYDPTIQVLDKIPSVREAVKFLQGHMSELDLVFMDIHLEDDLCFRIFDQINLQVPIIFTTAFDEYMIRAFKVNSIDYLLKPVSLENLSAAIDKFKSMKRQFSRTDLDTLLQAIGQNKPEYKTRFMVTVGTRIRTIDVAEVAYFFSEEKVTFMVTKDNQRLPIDYSLDKLTTMLNPDEFFRANRQFLASLSSIKNIHTYSQSKLKLELAPAPKAEVFIGKEKITPFKDWLDK
ncbi:LytTR family DNA-binding domain-containing protein [Telluribacter sp. SYSU D00476]|uniref:LytR/AlgR family response regulator transcription factor n=1 Tax=Telluribacter sp. SYSU D00476 TaxID=2811430 RepID=UPI001FF59919|nr:LytTR family DNA-binding domain-containing protein [Telluribacter sp. SYSU D00476]